MPERTLRLEEYEGPEPFYQLIIEPGMSRQQIEALRNQPPYVLKVHRFIFERQMEIRSGWPFDHIVTETGEQTIFGFVDSIFDYIRQSTPEEVARKLARTLHAEQLTD